ncbi:MAG: hypothetical protein MUE44_24090 [Oscillatoriaceae cyanobacterium Prado104]|jgi:hypothetical protein|nr:hypothetical protein [Oscillatoriaceae cyanobacterium Prado104]
MERIKNRLPIQSATDSTTGTRTTNCRDFSSGIVRDRGVNAIGDTTARSNNKEERKKQWISGSSG